MAGEQADLDVFRTIHDSQIVRDHGATGRRGPAATTSGLLLAQGLYHRLLQLPLGVGIDAGVDGLVTDVALGVVRMHPPEFACYLLG